jgi:hypothetical protein
MKTNQKSSGLAIASLVLGILSVTCLGLLAGLPAIILGHIAHNRARRQPDEYGGAGLAIAGFVTGYASLVVTIVMLGLLLPALSSAKTKAQQISCVNNLKQVGTAFRLWSGDYNDRFPFNVPAKDGGTLESCSRDAEGFDANSWRHFQVMSNELNTPKILVCPEDASKSAALDFASLGAGNVSYQVRSGTNIDETHPEEVLVRCPIHNNEVMVDGSVQQRPRKK